MANYKSLIGIDSDQVPLNQSLGSLAYQSKEFPVIEKLKFEPTDVSTFYKNSVENDGVALYFSNLYSKNAIAAYQAFERHADFAITGIVAGQAYPWLGASLNVDANTEYQFEAMFAVQRTTDNTQRSLQTSFSVPSGTTVTYISEASSSVDANTLASLKTKYITTPNATTITDPTNSTTEFNYVRLTGVIETNLTPGVIIPLLHFSAGTGNVLILMHSRMRVTTVGPRIIAGTSSVGNWNPV